MPGAGRFAPSPSGRMHFGNLRTAVAAYLFAQTTSRQFLVRVEDIDTGRSRSEYAAAGLQDLRALGLESELPVVYQSERHTLYETALERLIQKGLVYECYCSRSDIAAAASAPHGKPGIYPGICRDLPQAVRTTKRRELAQKGRQPALRLRAPEGVEFQVQDDLLGTITGMLHDYVLRRSDGDWAYQLAVVVDDMEQGVDQVVRGMDLFSSAPVQAWLTETLGGAAPRYAHIPLVLNGNGQRLAKRDGAVTLPELCAQGWDNRGVLLRILSSLGWEEAANSRWRDYSIPEILEQAVHSWNPRMAPHEPVIFGGNDGKFVKFSTVNANR
ncbi:glutamyl-tRNA synthetase [Mobiluncus mulieris]|uniref:Glutamyl-Q tRNA(Asp) synthetase n=1 Tax=Mobiluncus mulieris TaxID=2052 RepID=A0A8G2M6R3_9ACTO|nr:tRNA glutamyl-Q(34) synthetase GluQRS [Mobiluncus mulieris]MBB5847408.1 glutamyl-tRNA synthetase [Mobiluncus mulieris]STO16147.1 Glutamyl-Q tRNA(Asp) synthetase [Mobiluncus mulieris]